MSVVSGDDQRRQRARRTAVLLGALAVGIYVMFIVLTMLRG